MSCLDAKGEHTTEDKVFIKQMLLAKKGDHISQHSHSYAHTTLIAAGAVRLYRDGIAIGDYVAPTMVNIPAHEMHEFVALEDNTVGYCIHNVAEAGEYKFEKANSYKGSDRFVRQNIPDYLFGKSDFTFDTIYNRSVA